MISFTVRMTFREEDHDDVANHLRELTRLSRQEPGCVSYIPHWVDGDANTVVIYEQYKTEADVEAHRNTVHFAKHAVGGFYQVTLSRELEYLTAIA